MALVNGRPRTLNLKELLENFVAHRHEVVIRRTRYELNKAEARVHILEGLIIAVDNIDEVIHIIRSSKTTEEAAASASDSASMTSRHRPSWRCASAS